jgi:hypothetical protein
MSTIDQPIPECITRDRLTSPYWPNLSLAGLAAVVTLSLIFLLTSFHRLNHTDLWGHLNFGRWMAAHQALPATDPFAAEPAAQAVFQSAWLAQFLGYEVHYLFGDEGLVFAHALLVTLTAGVLMLAACRRGAPAIWASAAGAAMFLLDLPIVGTIRPQLFGQLGAALFLLACAEMPRRRHPLVWLPLVATLWANLHGSVLMGLAMLSIYAFSISFSVFREVGASFRVLRDRRLHIVWGSLLLVLAAASLNPHGPALLLQIAGFGGHVSLASISEWRPLWPQSLTAVLLAGSLVFTGIIARYSTKKWELHEVLMLLVLGTAVLPAIRMLAWWAIVWPWVMLPHAAAAWRAWQDSTGCEAQEFEDDRPTSMRTVLALGFLFMIALVSPPTFSIVSGRARGAGQIYVTDTPLYVADEIVRRNLTGHIATPMDWADFLVWNTDGRLRPLVYSHVHLTTPETWDDYQTIFRGTDSWLEKLHSHSMRYVLVSRRNYPALAKHILVEDRSGTGKLRIIYQDQRCLLAEIL